MKYNKERNCVLEIWLGKFEMGFRTLLLTAVTRIANGETYTKIS